MVSSEGLLPRAVEAELLTRWSEPHRHYHSVSHLEYGLDALARLGGERLEVIAFWCHDAVHSNRTPEDETASTEVARTLLADVLPADEVDEVCRLIMLTAGHRVEPGDDAGARLCDADLYGLGAPWEIYSRNVAGIRAELPQITDEQWKQGRGAFLRGFLGREWFYSSALGRELWQDQARANLARELDELTD